MIYGNVYKNERKQRAQRMLEAVGLGDRIHHMPAEMSGDSASVLRLPVHLLMILL